MYTLAGFGWDYLKERNHSFFTAEVHLRYLRELKEGDPVRVTFQLLDTRFKAAALLPAAFPRHRGLGLRDLRKHVAAHRHGGAEGCAVPARHCAKRLCEIKTSHGRLPRPEAVGKRHRDAAKRPENVQFCGSLASRLSICGLSCGRPPSSPAPASDRARYPSRTGTSCCPPQSRTAHAQLIRPQREECRPIGLDTGSDRIGWSPGRKC